MKTAIEGAVREEAQAGAGVNPAYLFFCGRVALGAGASAPAGSGAGARKEDATKLLLGKPAQ